MIDGELLGFLGGLLLTLFIYSYLLGDNWFYRVAVHILVGVSAAYAAVIAVEELFIPLFARLQADPTAPTSLLWLVPLLLSVLLLFTWLRPTAWLGNSAVGLLVGTGAAVALVGVITGTLIPQILSPDGTGPVGQAVIALLTIVTLFYFQFTVRANDDGREEPALAQRAITGAGRAMLMITFGALFAAAFATSVVLLIDRLGYIVGGLLHFTELFLP